MLLNIFISGQLHISYECLRVSLPSDSGIFEIKDGHYPYSTKVSIGIAEIENINNKLHKCYISDGMVVVSEKEINLFIGIIYDIEKIKKQYIDSKLKELDNLIKDSKFTELTKKTESKINYYQSLSKIII